MTRLQCIITALITGVVSVSLVYLSAAQFISTAGLLGLLNIVGWTIASALYSQRVAFSKHVSRCAKKVGVAPQALTLEKDVEQLLQDVYEKSRLLAEIPIQEKILGVRALSRCLDDLTELIYHTLDAESVEISLLNPVNGLFRNSLVKGIPLSSDIHDTLKKNLNISEDTNLDRRPLLERQIAFAGQKLGIIRVAFNQERTIGARERDLLSLLTTRCAVILIGHGYQEELLSLHEQTSQSEREQTNFLATLSHEIRGPLGIILNAVELVLDDLCGTINPDQRETLTMIHGNGKHLLELINDVLDYAKVEAGMIAVQVSEVGVEDLLIDLIQVVRAQADKKNHKLVLAKIEPCLGINCDRRHARQILINLLTNAIKYTPDGGTIEVSAQREDNDRVALKVKDSGIGIREDDFELVFSPFQRIENGYAQKQGGTGLGMPLCKRLLELNDGSISFNSVLGEGSEFIARLPYVSVSSDLEKVNRTLSRLTVQGRGEIVLIIAPVGEERLVLERYFKHAGFLALSCYSPEEIGDILKGPRLHLCVLDNEVLDSGHQELVDALRSHSAFGDLPIVVVTSKAFPHDIEHYLMMGVDRCFIKPLSLRELGRGVRELLDRKHEGKGQQLR